MRCSGLILAAAAVAGSVMTCGVGCSSSGLAVGDLKCEYAANPLGIDVARPRLSWTLDSREREGRQGSYQILVASDPETLKANEGDLWDTGVVASDETIQIAYGGKGLSKGQRVYWKVRVWDGEGKVSESRAAWWEMGLLGEADWQAEWIGYDVPDMAEKKAKDVTFEGCSWVWFPEGEPAKSAPVGKRYFRRVIELDSGRAIQQGRLLVTCDNSCKVFVNGKQVGQWNSFAQGHVFDVKKHLVGGRNVLAIEVENAGDAANPAGLAGRLRVDYEAGEPTNAKIDKTWKVSKTVGADWIQAEFNDSGWSPANEFAKVGDAPWKVPGITGELVLPPAPYLRKTFRVDKAVRRARLYASALGFYELHLNGAKVNEDYFRPGWTEYRKRVYYQTYDVTDQVRQGENAVGMILMDGWACGHIGWGRKRNLYGIPRPRGLAQLVVEYEDGSSATIVTDGSWKGAYGAILEGDMLMGETYDARREPVGWDRSGFDDSSWGDVVVQDEVGAKVGASPGVTVDRVMELKPIGVTEPTAGKFVFDLGQNMVGWARLKVRGEAGTRVVLRFAEMLNPDGTIYVTNLRGARATDTYVLKGEGTEVWEPRSTFHGFRYVELSGYPGRPSMDAVTGIVAHSNTPRVGTFECSSPMVNQLYKNVVWGQRGNFLEVPTDCPQRDERMGWMGDAQVFIRAATCNMDVARFFTKWLVDVEDAQREDGAFTDVAPFVAAGSGTPAWGDAGVICPWTTYLVYGDKRVLEAHYDAMTRWIAYLKKNSKDLLRPAKGYGDWLSIKADTPKDVIGTAFFAYSTSLVAKTARVLGKNEDAAKYEALTARIKAAFNKAYVDAAGRIKGNTQTCYVMALRMDLLPDDKRAAAVGYLVDDIKSRDWHLSTGFVGTAYLNPVLTRFGRTDVAYRLLNNETFPSWGYSIRHGATTIWERWDGWTEEKGFQDPGMNSFNHYAFGAVCEWMFATVAGIDLDPAQPGFKRVVIRPRPGGGLSYAKAAYDSIRGKVVSDWKIDGDTFRLKVTIPANTTAAVYVPAADPGAVTEGGKPAGEAVGVKFDRMEAGNSVFSVGSGTYSFSAKWGGTGGD